MRRFLLRLAWLAIFLCVPVQTAALAAEPAKPLTVQAVFEGQLPLAGMRFDVYRVADRSGGGTWSLEPRFKAYQTRLETQNGDGEAWAALARVLEKVALMEEACLPDASAEEELAADEPSVIISRRPCALLKYVRHPGPIEAKPEKCVGCKSCMKLGCPAISVMGGKVQIDNTLCTGCSLCRQLCHKGALGE